MNYRKMTEAEKEAERLRVRTGGVPIVVSCFDCGMTMYLIGETLRLDDEGYVFCEGCAT